MNLMVTVWKIHVEVLVSDRHTCTRVTLSIDYIRTLTLGGC